MCKPEITHIKDSLEDLVRSDPSIGYSQIVLPVATNFWNVMLPKLINPNKIPILYTLWIVAFYKFYNNSSICLILYAVGLLPILGSTLFLIMGMQYFKNKRKAPFKSAQDLLLERIQNKRAKRKKDAYDIFLPPPNFSGKTKSKIGMIFYPGSLINHTSYAPIASQLSDHGILVIVLSLEPARLIYDLDTNKKLAERAMEDVLSMKNLHINEWVIAGHSAGALTALNLALKMHSVINKYVGYGFSNLYSYKSLRDTSIQVLVVNASEDKLIQFASKKEREDFRNALPAINSIGSKGRTTYVNIEGGNHGGFGHYETSPLDGIRSISLEEQQRIAVEKTVEFLLRPKEE